MFDKKIVLYALVVVESIIWGFSFLGTKAALDNLNPIEVVVMRWTIAALVMCVLAFFGIIKTNFKGKNLKPAMMVAFVQPCIFSICEVYGINYTTTSESAILTSLCPIFVLLISIIAFRKQIGTVSGCAIVMAFVGIVFTVWFSPNFSAGGNYKGYLFLLASVTAGAVFTISSNKISDRFTPMELTIVMAVEGALFFNLISIAMGNGFSAYEKTFTNIDVFASVMFLALGCTALCYIIFNFVISKLPPHQASTLQMNLITLVGVISGIMIKGDPFGWYTIVGMILILTGIVLTNLYAGNSKQDENSSEIITE